MTEPNRSDPQPVYTAAEMVSASELREFVFCQRAWWLSRVGHAVSKQARVNRAEGIAFHEARAGAARKGSDKQALWWAILLALIAVAIWLARMLMEKSP